MSPLLLVTGAVGLTLIVTKGRIFADMRRALCASGYPSVRLLGELLSCSMCLGTWAGFAVGAHLEGTVAGVLLWGGAVSLAAWFACGVCCTLEILVEWLKKGTERS